MENWNNVVGRNDRVIIAGDFAFKRHTLWLSRLHGKKTIVLGNHDRMSSPVLSQFTEVHQFMDAIIHGQRVSIFHYPMLSWPASTHGSWHVHGHCHGSLAEPTTKLCCDVGVDVWGYAPVHWSTIVKKMQEKLKTWSGAISDEGKKSAEIALAKNTQTNRRLLSSDQQHNIPTEPGSKGKEI